MILETDVSDFDELAEAQQNWDLRYRPLSTGPFRARLMVSQLAAVQVDLESRSGAIEISGSAPAEAASFVLAVDPGSDYLSRGHHVSGKSIDFYGPGTEIHAATRRTGGMLSLVIDHSKLLQEGEALVGRELAFLSARHKVTTPDPAALRALRDWCHAILGTPHLDRQPDELERSAQDWATSQAIEHVVSALATDASDFARPNKRYALAREAQTFMLDRLDTPPTLAEVCAGLKIGQRTLHYAFLDVFGITPKAYLKAQRLLAARSLLKRADPRINVTAVMLQFGFFDAGHFAKDYRAMFGERPSETLRCRR